MDFGKDRQLTLAGRTIVGKVKILDKEFNFSFSNGYSLTIIPNDDGFDLREILKNKNNIDALKIIYGKDIDGYNICFITTIPQRSILNFGKAVVLVVNIILRTIDKISLCDNEGKSFGFKAIDFMGVPINSVYSPKFFIKRDKIKENSIEWLSPSVVAKVYSTNINKKNCKLIFTGKVERQDLFYDSISLGEVTSILRIEFEQNQDLSIIEDCWSAVCTFLSFCLGQKNVTNLYISLWNDERSIESLESCGLIHCYVNDEKENDIAFTYPPICRLQVAWLGDNIGELFSVLNNEQSPVLAFLPQNNHDIEIDRNKVRDLCTSLEVEWEYWKEDLNNTNVDQIINELKTILRDKKNANPAILDEATYQYIASSLSHITKPAKKKLLDLYMRYAKIITESYKYNPSVYTVISADEKQIEKDIKTFVKIRNEFTHSLGLTCSKLPNLIFDRLKIVVLCSILERAGYNKQKIKSIMIAYFTGDIKTAKKQEDNENAD